MVRLSRLIVARLPVLGGFCVLTLLGCTSGEPTRSPATSPDAATDARQAPSDAEPAPKLRVEAKFNESIHCVAPEGWVPTEGSGLQKVSFEVKEGTLTAEVSAMGVPGAATKLLPNANLWRKQVGLDDMTQEELDAALQPIEIGGRPGHYIQLVGPSTAERPLRMLAVLVSSQDRTWFFKMIGDVELVQRQQDRFESFLRSVTFVPDGGDKNE